MANDEYKIFNLQDIYLAYRKAKSEAFYETTHYNAIAYSTYEVDLDQNLRKLLRKLNKPSDAWDENIKFIGSYMYAPKGLDDEAWNISDIHYRALDPTEDCLFRFEESQERAKTSFRLMISPSVDYQIISALWILKVGTKYENKIDRDSCYGNRLRTLKYDEFEPSTGNNLNKECSTLFQPYFSAYRQWRENGLSSIKKSLEADQRIIAITMDVKSFYHNVSPKFILRKDFLDKLDIQLNNFEAYFTKKFLKSLETWYSHTPDFQERPEGALPVGLSASKLISNVLLCEFDQAIKDNLSPIYYGRYVDDLFLVLPAWKNKILSGTDVLKHIAEKLTSIAKYDQDKSALELKLSYAKDSKIILPSAKQKIFNLASKHGLDLIESISDQIRQQSSEYRLLAEVPETTVDMASRALLATPDATLNADALRKADAVSIRRLGFSLLLRDIETYERDLTPNSWKDIRNEFYGLVHRHLITLKGIFDYSNFIPRIFGLMIACKDFREGERLVSSLHNVFELAERTTTAGSEESAKFSCCKDRFSQAIIQNMLQASTVKGFQGWNQLGNLIKEIRKHSSIRYSIKRAEIEALSEKILLADWGRRPYKTFWQFDCRKNAKPVKIPTEIAARRIIRLSSIREFKRRTELKIPHWPALAFPTRPLKISELCLAAPNLLTEENALSKTIMALRGARVRGPMLQSKFIDDTHNNKRYISIPSETPDMPSVAITNLKITNEQWENSVLEKPDLTLARYRSIVRIINRILQDTKHPNYIVLPECSTPKKWAISFSDKLSQNKISFIAGLEYSKDIKTGKLRNDALISLTTKWPGYSSNLILTQPKLKPSHEEKKRLRTINKSKLHEPTNTKECLPIYFHGKFSFGNLICSDLTNISNRQHFQGEIDALFVLEWNQDVKTFSYLVESASHDINAFIVQVNNRIYGDSRIRAPYKKEFMRDSVRVKGGASDYYVTGLIDYISLRKFHFKSGRIKIDFKPVPIGFNPSARRKP